MPLDPLPPDFQFPWTKWPRDAGIQEMWTANVPQDIQYIWNMLPAKWKAREKGWGKDIAEIEFNLRMRCRQYLETHKAIRYLEAKEGRWLPQAYYVTRVTPISAVGAAAAFATGMAALMTAYYWSGILGNEPYGPVTLPKPWIDPTLLVNDNMESGKGPELIASDPSVKFSLARGQGLAGSNALRIEFSAIPQTTGRLAIIKYLFPGPTRQFLVSAFSMRHERGNLPHAMTFRTDYSWDRKLIRSGFYFTSTYPQQPWRIMSREPKDRMSPRENIRSVPSEFFPSWCEVDSDKLEYTKLNAFNHLYNVKGIKPYVDSLLKPRPGEFVISILQPFHMDCTMLLDAVILYEYGPILYDFEAELHRRIKDWPLPKRSDEQA